MNASIQPLAEITEKAIRILCKEIGVADTIRFLNQFSNGQGNYTEERRSLFEGLTVENIVREIEHERLKSN